MIRRFLPRAAFAMSTLMPIAVSPTNAAEVYVSTGFPVFGIGIAQPISPSFTVRGDYGLLPKLADGSVEEEGIRYNADATFNRVGLFGDWHVNGGGFRLTGGLTFNRWNVDLTARPTSGSIEIGGQTFAVGVNDGLDVQVEFPKTTPYIGIGWGHNMTNPGWSFNFDFGVSIGKAKVTAVPVGALAVQPGIQAAIDTEIRELEDGIGKVKVMPQLTIGVGYRF